jgi:Dolichyl-phosphate-mannose-protein mannosyltransferase
MSIQPETTPRIRLNWRGLLPFLVLMLLAGSIRAVLINRPFLPNDEGTAAGIPVMHAVNFARYGPLASRFGGVLNTGHVDPSNWFIYTHHPPLVPLLIAAMYKLCGIAEWSTRAVPALFSLATTALLYAIARRRFNQSVAFLAGLFYACAPMTIALGAMPDYINGQVAFFMLGTVETYLRWRETRRRSWLAVTVILFLLGALSDWVAFYLAPILAGHYWLRTSSRYAFAGAMALLASACAVFVVLVLWADWAGGGVSVFHLFAGRSFASSITFQQWVEFVILQHMASLHTWPVFVLAVTYAGVAVIRFCSSRRAVSPGHEIVTLLMLIVVVHLGVAIQGNSQSWWLTIATAPLALAAAVGCETILRALVRDRWRKWGLTAMALFFLSCSAPAAYRKLTEQWPVDSYTPRELGLVIRSISRPDEGVLTSAQAWDPTLRFYADRQLRSNIESVSALSSSLSARWYGLPYEFYQLDGPCPRWFVMPPEQREALKSLAAELSARFPRRDVGGYAVYQLSDR